MNAAGKSLLKNLKDAKNCKVCKDGCEKALAVCGACMEAVYCGSSCQLQDWGDHQKLCLVAGNDGKRKAEDESQPVVKGSPLASMSKDLLRYLFDYLDVTDLKNIPQSSRKLVKATRWLMMRRYWWRLPDEQEDFDDFIANFSTGAPVDPKEYHFRNVIITNVDQIQWLQKTGMWTYIRNLRIYVKLENPLTLPREIQHLMLAFKARKKFLIPFEGSAINMPEIELPVFVISIITADQKDESVDVNIVSNKKGTPLPYYWGRSQAYITRNDIIKAGSLSNVFKECSLSHMNGVKCQVNVLYTGIGFGFDDDEPRLFAATTDSTGFTSLENFEERSLDDPFGTLAAFREDWMMIYGWRWRVEDFEHKLLGDFRNLV